MTSPVLQRLLSMPHIMMQGLWTTSWRKKTPMSFVLGVGSYLNGGTVECPAHHHTNNPGMGNNDNDKAICVGVGFDGNYNKCNNHCLNAYVV